MKSSGSELIIDVGSASVGACLVQKGKTGKPIISFVKRVSIKGTGLTDARALATQTHKAISDLLSQYRSSKPTYVRFVLASPWYESTIKMVTAKSDSAVRITENSVAKVVAEYEGKHELAEGRHLIERVVPQVYVNGYGTSLSKSVKGTSLRVNVYESQADATFVAALTASVEKAFSGAEVSFHSFPLIAFVVLRALRDEKDFMFVDVGGEVTDVVITREDSLRFIGSFPKGTASVVRHLSLAKGSISDAQSRLSLFTRSELSEKETKQFKGAFETATAQWGVSCEEALQSAAETVPIPQTAFIAADKEELRWLEKALEGMQGSFPKNPIFLSPDFFHEHIEIGEGALYDAFLSLQALFFHIGKQDLIAVE